MDNTHSSNSYKKNCGFTMIELLVVIGIIGILATTLAPKLMKSISKAKVAEVQNKLGLIRSKLAIDITLSDEFPDLSGADDNLRDQFEVHPTRAFSSEKGSYGETDKIVGIRDNTGGWFYNRTKGEIYANLPNGAYTYDETYEIWKGEGFVTLEDLQNLEDVGDVKAMAVNENGEYINNSGFEPLSKNFEDWKLFDDNQIEYWSTTNPDDKIEIWEDGFNKVDSVGDYFMELNGQANGSVYQDVVTIPGTILEVSVSHMGRKGEDIASLSIEGTEEILMTDGKGTWGTYTYEYEVPQGQTVTRFSLDSISSVGGKSYGNLIDNFTVKVKLN